MQINVSTGKSGQTRHEARGRGSGSEGTTEGTRGRSPVISLEGERKFPNGRNAERWFSYPAFRFQAFPWIGPDRTRIAIQHAIRAALYGCDSMGGHVSALDQGSWAGRHRDHAQGNLKGNGTPAAWPGFDHAPRSKSRVDVKLPPSPRIRLSWSV